MKKNYLQVGQIVTTHGLKGDVKIYPYTDDLENLASKKKFYLDENLTKELKVVKQSIFKNVLLTRFENYRSIEEAQVLVGSYVYLPKEKIKEEDTYYVDDLLNIEVYSLNEKGTYDVLGKITDVFNTGANDVYEIEKEDKSKIYLPAIASVVLKVEIEEQKMYVKLMEGLV